MRCSTQESQPLKPACLTARVCSQRSTALRNLCSASREERKPMQQRRPSTTKNKRIMFLEKDVWGSIRGSGWALPPGLPVSSLLGPAPCCPLLTNATPSSRPPSTFWTALPGGGRPGGRDPPCHTTGPGDGSHSALSTQPGLASFELPEGWAVGWVRPHLLWGCGLLQSLLQKTGSAG